jgi:hypothetical protein
MKIKKYQKLSDDEIEVDFIWFHYDEAGKDEALTETRRLMWAMCRDRFEKEVLLEHWSKRNDYERLSLKVESFKYRFIERVTKIAESSIKPAPTWLDIYL